MIQPFTWGISEESLKDLYKYLKLDDDFDINEYCKDETHYNEMMNKLWEMWEWMNEEEDKKKEEFLNDFGTLYNPEIHLKYDNIDAINCDKTNDIPLDYDGLIGVPITFMDKYDHYGLHNIFDIVGQTEIKPYPSPFLNGKAKYRRILIRKKDNVKLFFVAQQMILK